MIPSLKPDRNFVFVLLVVFGFIMLSSQVLCWIFRLLSNPEVCCNPGLAKARNGLFCFYLSNRSDVASYCCMVCICKGNLLLYSCCSAFFFLLFPFPQLDGAAVKIAHPSATINTNSKRTLITDFQCKLLDRKQEKYNFKRSSFMSNQSNCR